MRTITTALIGGCIALGAALSLAPTASADASTDQFGAALAAQGIPAISGLNDLAKTAHEVCDDLNGGMSVQDVEGAFVEFANSVTPGADPDRLQRTAVRFVRAAAMTYCPGFAGQVKSNGHYRVILAGANAPAPSLPAVADAQQMVPPKAVAPPPAPKQAPPVVGPPQGSGGGGGGTGGGANRGGHNDGPGIVSLAP
jgi:Protein of unknown function (DUF732)